ncbi:DMT family transporter [Pseudomonas lijiangensis]|uniref:DMT family transporter n=1 Tax=Pseudomonas lijiangensis TaxID=2995658 RepID=UPI0031BB9691
MNTPQKSVLLSDLMLLAVAVVWGSSYGVVKSALFFYPVLGLLALRFGITFLLLSPALIHLRDLPANKTIGLLGTGGLLLGVFLCETFGILHTTATNAAFLISLCVMLTPLVEWVWLKRRPTGMEWCAVGLSAIGAALLTGDGKWVFNWGDALILLAAFIRALQVCMLKRVTNDTRLPALTVTAVQAGVVTLGSILLVILFVPTPLQTLVSMENSSVFWSYVVYLVLACTLFAFFAQNYAIKRSSPTRVALLMGSEPVFGGLFAMLWLGESISYQGWAGGGLIVVACLLASVRWTPGKGRVMATPAQG